MATRGRKTIAVATPNSGHPNPLISHEKLRQLYSLMLKCRLLNERVQLLARQAGFDNEFSAFADTEATVVGTVIDLRVEDTLTPSHRNFLLSYVKGEPLAALFSRLFWRELGQHHGSSALGEHATFKDILPASTVVAELNMCTDIAFANQQKANENVVLFFSREGASAMNAWQDALYLAGQRTLPIIFVRQINSWARSESAPFNETGGDPSAESADCGFPTIAVDAQDVVAMYRVAHEAIERARSGGRPTLIEAHSFREYKASQTACTQNRVTDHFERVESGDSVAVMEHYLRGKGLFSEGWKNEIIAAFQREFDAAINAAESDSCGASA